MKTFIQKNWKLLIAILAVFILAFLFKPQSELDTLKKYQKKLEQKEKQHKHEYDSIHNVRKKEKQSYKKIIADREYQIQLLNKKLDKAFEKITEDEKPITNYPVDFDERFVIFSDFVTYQN